MLPVRFFKLPILAFCISFSVVSFAQITLLSDTATARIRAKAQKNAQERVLMETRLVDKPFPDFAFYTLDGKPITQNVLLGKVTILNCWKIGCIPCMQEIPYLNKLVTEFKDDDFQLISFCAQTKDNINSFLGRDTLRTNYISSLKELRGIAPFDTISYPIVALCDTNRISVEGDNIYVRPDCDILQERFDVSAFPTTFFIDKKGIVRKCEIGFAYIKDPKKNNDPIREQIDFVKMLLNE